MEITNESLGKTPNSNTPLELQLLGIDKKWVRSRKGGWVEKGSEEALQTQSKENDPFADLDDHAIRWWQFWKKKNEAYD